MFGTMQGILTPLMDNFSVLGRHRTLLTGTAHLSTHVQTPLSIRDAESLEFLVDDGPETVCRHLFSQLSEVIENCEKKHAGH